MPSFIECRKNRIPDRQEGVLPLTDRICTTQQSGRPPYFFSGAEESGRDPCDPAWFLSWAMECVFGARGRVLVLGRVVLGRVWGRVWANRATFSCCCGRGS